MRTDKPPRSARAGQAAVEFAVGVFVFTLAALFLLDLAPVLVRALDLQSDARADAGAWALAHDQGDAGAARAGGTGDDGEITRRAHPAAPVGVALAVAPWDYPVRTLAGDAAQALGEWRGNAVRALETHDGFKNEPVMLPVFTDDGRLFEMRQTRLEEHVSFTGIGLGPGERPFR